MSTRIPTGDMFPILLARACLADFSIPEEYRNKMVKHGHITKSDLRFGNVSHDGPREEFLDVVMRVHVYGTCGMIRCSISLHRVSGFRDWDSATCDLFFEGQQGRVWKFKAEITDDELEVELTGHPDLAQPEYQYAQPGPGAIQHD